MSPFNLQRPPDRGGTFLALPIALLCGVGSVAVAVVSGWQGGAATPDRLLLAYFNIVAALSAQLLPALSARQSGMLKAGCITLWLLCMGWAASVHASYFLAAQSRSGQARFEDMKRTRTPLAPTRDVASIRYDKANLIDQLARLQASKCATLACSSQRQLRLEAQTERLNALEAEEQASTKISRTRELQEQRELRALEDVTSSSLANSLALPYEGVTLARAAIVALLLEGVACVCWAVVFRGVTGLPSAATARESAVTDAVTEPASPRVVTTFPDSGTDVGHALDVPVVTPPTGDGATHGQTPGAGVTYADHDFQERPPLGRARDFNEDVIRVTAALRDSKIKLTVKGVRDHLGCNQLHARKVRAFVAQTIDSALAADSHTTSSAST